MRDYCFEPHGPQATLNDEPATGLPAWLVFALYLLALAICAD